MGAIFGRRKKVNNQVVTPRPGKTDVGFWAAGDVSHSVELLPGIACGEPRCLNLGALMPF